VSGLALPRIDLSSNSLQHAMKECFEVAITFHQEVKTPIWKDHKDLKIYVKSAVETQNDSKDEPKYWRLLDLCNMP
jgi:hypothetical protein